MPCLQSDDPTREEVSHGGIAPAGKPQPGDKARRTDPTEGGRSGEDNMKTRHKSYHVDCKVCEHPNQQERAELLYLERGWLTTYCLDCGAVLGYEEESIGQEDCHD